MELLQDLFSRLRDLPELVRWAGTVGMMLIIFCETGLLVGLFLPGDSLLVTAGLLGATRPEFGIHVFSLGFLLVASAIVGDSVGYQIGRFTGPKLFTREDGLIFKRKYLKKANDFYQKHGGKTVILAKRLAHLHARHPDWDLCFVFFTKSLADGVRGRIVREYQEITGSNAQPDWERVRVWHAWGGAAQQGFYHHLCQTSGAPFEKFDRGKTTFAGVCDRLEGGLRTRNSSVPALFDAYHR
ncbi:MAG: hypothetical protein HC933_17425 [Pleurocapsa sp. SU_196_0]|nr:hypothetical protein [Pleurocapsa sp. SU_196_0]